MLSRVYKKVQDRHNEQKNNYQIYFLIDEIDNKTNEHKKFQTRCIITDSTGHEFKMTIFNQYHVNFRFQF